MSLTCPSCGAPDYGTPFCVACQQPMKRDITAESAPVPEDPRTALSLQGAGFFRRLGAFAIDWLVISLLADLMNFAYRFGSEAGSSQVQMDAAMGLSGILFFLYFTLLTGEGGQTLGKMLMGIRVQGTDGSAVGYGRALLRTLAYLISIFFGTFLGFLWALWDRRGQAWHDKIAGTIVIRV